jgi:hypothetical protein
MSKNTLNPKSESESGFVIILVGEMNRGLELPEKPFFAGHTPVTDFEDRVMQRKLRFIAKIDLSIVGDGLGSGSTQFLIQAEILIKTQTIIALVWIFLIPAQY